MHKSQASLEISAAMTQWRSSMLSVLFSNKRLSNSELQSSKRGRHQSVVLIQILEEVCFLESVNFNTCCAMIR